MSLCSDFKENVLMKLALKYINKEERGKREGGKGKKEMIYLKFRCISDFQSLTDLFQNLIQASRGNGETTLKLLARSLENLTNGNEYTAVRGLQRQPRKKIFF